MDASLQFSLQILYLCLGRLGVYQLDYPWLIWGYGTCGGVVERSHTLDSAALVPSKAKQSRNHLLAMVREGGRMSTTLNRPQLSRSSWARSHS
jgi:hypothetical protein